MVLKDRLQLRKLMDERGVSYGDVAKAAGWKSRGHVGHLLSGRKSTVTPASAVHIADLLDVPVEGLFMLRASSVSGRDDNRGKAA